MNALIKRVVFFFIVCAWVAASNGDTLPAKLESRADLQRAFLEAGQAYDHNDYDEAIRRYESIQEQGYISPELFFNLGNAYFKKGRMGFAVLNYRKAWYLHPRDADVHANLRFALQNTGGASPVPHWITAGMQRIDFREWLALAVIAYWLFSISLGAFILNRSRPSWLRRLIYAPGFVMVISVAGLSMWLSYYRHPDLVVVESSRQALYAPIEGSTPHFAVPEGSIVRFLAKSGPWVKIETGNETGWVPQSACRSASPWKDMDRL